VCVSAQEEEGDEEGSEEDEEEDEEDDEDDDGEDDEDEEMDVDHAGLLQMVEGLSGKGKSSDAAGMMAMELQNMPDSAFGTGLTQGLTLESMLDSLKVRREFVSRMGCCAWKTGALGPAAHIISCVDAL
jgi:U3 small nucleolar RNA-associated protein 14